ncbi:MAG TPA: hypothetical protein VK762_17130 [Polyangiaceae bacterium]|nr:hypothetical protein [Polyangiaceae bacterium]
MSGEQLSSLTPSDARSSARDAGVRWSIVTALVGAGLLVGCVADSTSSSSGSAGGGPYGSSTSQAAQPLLVDVDTDATLVTTPGNGIGVYVEYQSGGHWRVSWTCDTALTNLSCNFVVDASVTTGSIANPASEGFEGADSVTQASSRQIEAVTTTTTGDNAILFDATPGAVITVTVSLNAPVSFFFVEENKVNGGYNGALTNPLMFQPTTP